MTDEYFHPEVETAPRDHLRAMQLARLQWQLRRCFERSAFYRDRLRGVGFTPADLKSLEDLERLPTVTKDELREEQIAHPPFGRFVVADADSWSELHPSTGTTGTPVSTIWSATDVDNITAVTTRTLWQLGARAEDTIQNAFAYGLWVAGISVHYAAVRMGAFCVPTGASIPTQHQIDYLRAARSTVLIATPSYGMHIAEALRASGTAPETLALRIGAFGGEAGTESGSTRHKLETGLGIEAYDYYGLAEVGPTFASECPEKAGLHFAEDHILVECLDPLTRQPVPDGELGVLVFTHLTREATPMIRYWSNDYARLDRSACGCGRTHVRAPGGIVGRHDDLLIFKGAKFYPVQVEKAVRSFPELSDEFRIEIRRDPASSQVLACDVVAEWSPQGPVDGADLRLRRALKDELGVTPGLRVEPFGTLERTTFKAKRIVHLGSARDGASTQGEKN